MKKIILAVILTLIVIIAAFTVYIYSGSYNVSQLAPHNTITKWAINTAKEKSISKRIQNIKVPPMNDTSMLVEGFRHYNEMCSTCHGGPGISPDELAKGLYPKPPKFYKSKDMPKPSEAFWVIKNGIKYTAMPAFGPTHNDQKIWAITDFVLNKMNKMSPEEYQYWIKKYSGKDTD
ncbi:MAG TPA: cytochrome c [Hanamia sp.]|nr:cytochrome c [Hanamia sp.]